MKATNKLALPFASIFHKKSKSSDTTTLNKPTELPGRAFFIEHATLPCMQIKFTSEQMKQLTCGELFKEVGKVIQATASTHLSNDNSIKSIIQLQTKERILSLDYWLTLKDKSACEIPNGTILTTYIGKPKQGKICIEDFEYVAKIGDGAFGTVCLGKFDTIA